MQQNKLIVFLVVMSVIVLGMFNFTMFSQFQMYTLEQYRLAKVDYDNGDYEIANNVYNFENSGIEYATDLSADVVNGLIIVDNHAYHVVNNKPNLINLEGDASLNNIYSQYLAYYYSFYLSPIMLIIYLLAGLCKSIIGIAIIYLVYRLILHKVRRDDVYIRSTKFIDYKLSIAITLLLGNLIFAYSSFLVGYRLSIIMYAIMIVSSYVLVLKGIKKFKR